MLGSVERESAFVVAELISFAGFEAAVVVGIKAAVLAIGDLESSDEEGLVDHLGVGRAFVRVALVRAP